MRRAAVSILSNIAEGFERDSPAESVRFLAIAKGSAGELRAQLYLAEDRGYLMQEQFRQLHDRATQVSRMLSALTAHLRQHMGR